MNHPRMRGEKALGVCAGTQEAHARQKEKQHESLDKTAQPAQQRVRGLRHEERHELVDAPPHKADRDKTQDQEGKLAGGLFVVCTENLNDRIIWP